jgi:hypothetical protein
LLDREVSLHWSDVELASSAVGTRADIVEVDDAGEIGFLAVVDDLKNAFLPD